MIAERPNLGQQKMVRAADVASGVPPDPTSTGAGAADDVLATITYTNCQPAYIIKANHIEVRGNGTPMRLRDANIDCTTGNLTQVRQSLADLTTAVTDLTYFTNGNLQTVTGPANKAEQRYTLTYTYDPTVATHGY